MPIDRFYLAIFIFLVLTSCSITDNIRNMQLEVMRPGLIDIPESADTIAILYNDSFKSEDNAFSFHDGRKLVQNLALNYDTLLSTCTDSLKSNLEKAGYFRKIYDYADSFDLSAPDDKVFIDYLFRRTKADVCVMLRNIKFYQSRITKGPFLSVVPTKLDWIILLKNDSTAYIFHQADTLIYNYFVVDNLMKKDNPKLLLENAAGYMGKSCASRLIPDWMPVERMYYRSANPEMRKAENFALNNDWISAAKIWNRKSKSKNGRLAAKAAFDMSLACEMEGKPDLAIDWVIQSANKKFHIDSEIHRQNCQRYIVILNKRKKEIEKLNLQIRQPKNEQSSL